MKRVILVIVLLAAVVFAHRWSEPEVVVGTDAMEFTCGPGKNSQLVGPDGTLHLVYFSDQDEPDNREIYYVEKSGVSWSEPVRISNGEKNSHGPTMAIDDQGNITVVWYDYRINHPYPDLFYARYDASSKTWSEDLPFVVIPGNNCLHPVAVAEPGGKVHLVWGDGRDEPYGRNELYYTYWENGQWAPEVPITNVGVRIRAIPTMSLDGLGQLHLFWADSRIQRDEYFIYYMKMSSDGTWGDEVNLGSGGPQDIAFFENMLFLSHFYVPEGEEFSMGIMDPDSDVNAQIRYSVKDISDPDDVWLLLGHKVSIDDDRNTKQAAIETAWNGVRLVWLEGQCRRYNLYQATVGLNGISVPEIISPIIGSHAMVSLSAGPEGDLNMIYLYTEDKWETRDIYYRHDAVPGRPGDDSPVPAARITAVYPNPTSGDAVLHLDIQSTGDLEVAVYDTAGRRVGTVFRGTLTAGRHELVVETGGLRSGAYFIQATAGGRSVSTPLVVTR